MAPWKGVPSIRLEWETVDIVLVTISTIENGESWAGSEGGDEGLEEITVDDEIDIGPMPINREKTVAFRFSAALVVSCTGLAISILSLAISLK
jgi:hypothetical protein